MDPTPADAERALRSWFSQRADLWPQLEERLARLQRRGDHEVEDVNSVVDAYHTLARDLSMARRLMPDGRATRYLEVLYRRAHMMITRPARRYLQDFVRLVRVDVPAIVRELRTHIATVVTLFVASAAAGWWLISTYPELVSLIASEEMINDVERGKLWTDDILNVVPSSLMSTRIFANNVIVSVTTFCLGLLFGLGTFYIITLNGLMLGGVFAFTRQHDMGLALLKWVSAHGPVELTAICIAGAAGAAVGEALIRPGALSRRASFQAAVARVGKLLLFLALLLSICALIEGFISPDDTFPLWSRLTIGWLYWLLAVLALSGRLWPVARTP